MATPPEIIGSKGGDMKSALMAVALCAVFLFASCQNGKALQENTQLKAQVLDLQKQLGQMGNRVEEATKARDDLAKENATLKQENDRLKQRRTAAKPAKKKRRRSA